MTALWIALGLVLGGALGAFAGYSYRKNAQEKKIGRTEEYARNLLEDAQRRAEDKKKETILEAKEEVLRLKTELDREVRDRRNEVQRSERRVQQREESLDKKMDSLEAREESLNRKQEELQRLTDEAQDMHDRQLGELERIAPDDPGRGPRRHHDPRAEGSLPRRGRHGPRDRTERQGGGRQEGAQHHRHGDPALRVRPRGRDNRLRRQPCPTRT